MMDNNRFINSLSILFLYKGGGPLRRRLLFAFSGADRAFGGKMCSLKAIAHTKEAGWKEGDI